MNSEHIPSAQFLKKEASIEESIDAKLQREHIKLKENLKSVSSASDKTEKPQKPRIKIKAGEDLISSVGDIIVIRQNVSAPKKNHHQKITKAMKPLYKLTGSMANGLIIKPVSSVGNLAIYSGEFSFKLIKHWLKTITPTLTKIGPILFLASIICSPFVIGYLGVKNIAFMQNWYEQKHYIKLALTSVAVVAFLSFVYSSVFSLIDSLWKEKDNPKTTTKDKE